jgi:hypothetical protein
VEPPCSQRFFTVCFLMSRSMGVNWAGHHRNLLDGTRHSLFSAHGVPPRMTPRIGRTYYVVLQQLLTRKSAI